MFERILRMIIADPVFWTAAALSAALAGCAHYLMKHYHWCVDGWKRIGRYIIGILCIAAGFAGWWTANLDASGPRVVSVAVLNILSVCFAVLAAYGLDNTFDRERCHEDLDDRGLKVGD